MTAPLTNTPPAGAALAALPPKEVTHEEDAKEIHGLFVLPNGKKYKITHLVIDGVDYTNTQLNKAHLEQIKNILKAVWEEKSKEIGNSDILSMTFPNNSNSITLTGKGSSAATNAFNATIQFTPANNLEAYFKSLKQNLPKVSPPKPQPTPANAPAKPGIAPIIPSPAASK